jgi:ubiquinone/menaquinone biosynthesis C-methylase UbiE
VLKRVLHELVARPQVYDVWQKFTGSIQVIGALKDLFPTAFDRTVLELGAGTGNNVAALSASGKYVWYDNDPQKLSGFRAKYPAQPAVLGDATQLSFGDRSIDTVLCVCVSHHLSPEELKSMFQETARVCKAVFLFVDIVTDPKSWLRTTLLKYDRGQYPRSREELRAMMLRNFDVEECAEISALYRYVIYRGRPRASVSVPA